MNGCRWPVLKRYKGKQLRRIALPLGGIGTGTVSLGGRGNLHDWAIMNNPAIGYTPVMKKGMRDIGPFFCLYTESSGNKKTIALEGPLDSELFEAAEGSRAINHGLPRFRRCQFDTAYPLAQVHFEDEAIPLDVTLKAFNPLVPADSHKSGIPAAILTYQLKNVTGFDISAAVCGTIINHIGSDGREFKRDWDGRPIYTGAKGNINTYRADDHIAGLFMSSKGVSKKHPAWGTMAISTTSTGEISYRTSWSERTWGDSTLDFWDDFSADGLLTERQAKAPYNQMGSLAVKKNIPAGELVEITFLLSWHFPNRHGWHPVKVKLFGKTRYNRLSHIGNYYTTQYSDAWDVAEKTLADLPQLEEDTVRFVSTFCNSSLPQVVKEAALFNVSTLRSQTTFRTPDGHMYGWEGVHDFNGSCFGSCTHVWNYEQTTAFLFGDLAKNMRKTEFLVATKRDGRMTFRTFLPRWVNRVVPFPAAADGQMGCIMKVYREWQLSGDHDFLATLWPQVRKSLEFCWLDGSWDADKDGVMEGCQHNTMDVEYYGPNPQMQGWYLGALRAAEEMALAMGEEAFARSCRALFDSGSATMDEMLFNGEYYEQIVKVPKKIRRGLTSDMGAKSLDDPIMQLGAGCLVDQLVGQYMAHVLGLGYLHNRENIRKTLTSIMQYNFKEGFYDHFNQMRSYVLNDEAALLMATYPRGDQPAEPFPYYNEAMTGFEHSAAAHMLYEGLESEGLQVISAIRNRYDGYKRNPFDEAECGHHYARAMAAWAHILAMTGFHYSGVKAELSFKAHEGNFFWSTGYAWGNCTIEKDAESWRVILEIMYGKIVVKFFLLKGVGIWEGSVEPLAQGNSLEISISPSH